MSFIGEVDYMFSGATNYAESVDSTMLLIVGISLFFLIGITVTMIYFVFRYSRKRNPKATQIHGHVGLEIAWIVIPLALVMMMFYYSFTSYHNLRATANESLVVDVKGRMWQWDYTYPNGKKSDTLYIPVDRVTRLEMRSEDVNHSFYIPAFRLKEDVIASRNTYLILTPKVKGTFDVACAEYCGLNHSYMYSTLKVVDADWFDTWYESENTGLAQAPQKEVTNEEKLEQKANQFAEALRNHESFQLLKKHTCITCHSTDGSVFTGPSFKGLFDGDTEIYDEEGNTRIIEIDRDYIVNSIIDPDKQIAVGFKKYMMPTHKGRISDDELNAITDMFMELMQK